MSAAAGLMDQGIRLHRYSVGNHKTVCPNCSRDRRKKGDPCLSVTIEDDGGAVFNCHHCGWTGNVTGETWKANRPRKNYRRPARVAAQERPDKMLAWFAQRGISSATVEAAGIYRTRHWFPQLNAEADCIAFPYEVGGELCNVKYRDKEKHFAQEKDAEPVLYGADFIGETTIFVEGEMDVLALREAGFQNVVSLPNGAPAGDEKSDLRYVPLHTHADALEKVKKFLIATDQDAPGERLANELARRLGKDRCWRVSFPDINDVKVKDANDCLVHAGVNVLVECIANAQPWPIDGLHGAGEYRSAVMDLYYGRGAVPLSTGWHEMDAAFKVLPGQFIVVTGIPNHGKSQWLDQLAMQMNRLHGWKWGMFSPEGGGVEAHIATLAEIWLGRPFYVGPHDRMDEKELQIALNWVDNNIIFIESKDHTPTIDWVLERARAAVLRHGIRGLIVDPYNEIEASRPQGMTETEFVSQLISKCKRFAQAHDVTVFMVVHPTKLQSQGLTKEPIPGLYDLSGSAHWRNKCDAGLVVYRDFDEGQTIVFSKKIRRQPICGNLGSVAFFFNPVLRKFEDSIGSYEAIGKKRENAA